MSYFRFSLDLAIPEAIYNGISLAVKQNIRDRIRDLKAYAQKINAGQANEEDTIRARWHICRHDEGKPCEPEVEV